MPNDSSAHQMPLASVVSGGQTGVDRGALDAALEFGFPCGGWCPRSRQAEDGTIPERYPVQELASGGYRQRTMMNVLDSDGTLIIHFGPLEGGTAQTRQHCIRRGKPFALIDGAEASVASAAQMAATFIVNHNIAKLNVAGPRASKEPSGQPYARAVLSELLRVLFDSRRET